MKFKRFLMPILAFTVVLTAMAFTLPGKFNAVKNAKAVDPEYSYYFIYNGPSPSYDINDYLDPDNYTLLPDNQNPYEQCEYGTDAVCMVLTERFWNGFEWKPNFNYYQAYGSAYWGLHQYCMYGYPSTSAVILKPF
ncbi:hypothetical protein [Pedobacter ginsengisoli]|uniref:hypothetical protein n=1 Tax=Pedobacter ginsengisoli TaxID=363852 RepID=UPI002549CE18|nr:hypothetical protein [Pedobacter ginsengisoli]